MVQARHALVGLRHARLLEEAQVVVVVGAGDPQEDRAGTPPLHLEAEHLAVEAHAALDVRDPQDQVLKPPEADAVAVAHPGSSTRALRIRGARGGCRGQHYMVHPGIPWVAG